MSAKAEVNIDTTEDRLDLDDFGEDLPHSLPPPFRPARFEEIADQERHVYRRLVVPLRKVRRETFRILGIPDPGRTSQRGLRDPVVRRMLALRLARKQIDWTGASQADWNKAITEYLKEIQGSADLTQAEAGWQFSEGILPEEWKLGMEVGVNRTVLLTGADEAALVRFDPRAIEAFGEKAFTRLSEDGRSRIGGYLTDLDRKGGSIESIIRTGIEEGTNPNVVARDLAAQFDGYERYEFARLTRTEVAFAQEEGLHQELGAEGWTEIAGARYPPYHPSCACSSSVDFETGLIVPDISVTACEVCQAAGMEASFLAAEAAVGNPFG